MHENHETAKNFSNLEYLILKYHTDLSLQKEVRYELKITRF